MTNGSPIRAFAVDLAREAGSTLREALGGQRQVQHKSRADLVTDVDLRSEALITARIKQHYPEHVIVAEEAGGTPDDGPTWLIDPLDGTTNYAHGYPVFAVSLALQVHNTVVLGVVYDPLRDECFVAERGAGAWLNDRQIHVSATTSLDQALLSTGFPYSRWTNPRNNLAQFNRMIMSCQGTRRSGSAALDLSYVAAGRSDGHWELQLRPWDSAAGMLLVAEAGGAVSDWQGNPTSPWKDEVVATNGAIQRAVLAILAEEERNDPARH